MGVFAKKKCVSQFSWPKWQTPILSLVSDSSQQKIKLLSYCGLNTNFAVGYVASVDHNGLISILEKHFLIEILHRDLRSGFFLSAHLLSISYLDFYFPFLFGLLLPFSIWTFIFPFLLGLLFLFLDFYFFFGLLFPFSHKSRSDLGFLPSFFNANQNFFHFTSLKIHQLKKGLVLIHTKLSSLRGTSFMH